MVLKNFGIDHERINASPYSINDFNDIIDATMDYMYGRIVAWEKQYKEKIEQVGR